MSSIFRKYFLSSYSGFSIKTWVTILATFVNSIGTSASIFIAIYLSIALHFSIDHIAYIVSAAGLGSIAGAYVGGYLCDKFDAYKISIVMLVASGVSISLIITSSQFFILLLLMLITGFFNGAFKPANTINLLQDYPIAERAKVNGLSRVAVNLGIGTASLLGGILAEVSYQSLFWLDSIASWIAAFILLYFSHLFKSNQTKREKIHQQRKRSGLLGDKIVVTICLLLLLNCIVFFQSWTTYPLYLNKYYHFSASQFGYLFFMNCLMIVLFEVPILNIVKNYNQVLVATFGSFVLCFSLFILAFSTRTAIAILSCALLTIGEILLFSTVLAITVNRSNESNKGKYVGFYQSMFSTGNMLAPITGSFIYTRSPTLLWYGCGLIGVICVLIFHWVNISWSKSSTELAIEVST